MSPPEASLTAHPQPDQEQESQASPLGQLGNLEDTVVIKSGNLFVVSMRDGRLPA